ncbi:MAG: porin [Planctomycetota bacterium]
MHRSTTRAALAATTAASLALAASAQTEAQKPTRWIDSIRFNAFAEASWSHGFNRPDSGRNTLRVFDLDDDEVALDVAEFVAQRAAADAGEFGFRVDAVTGTHVPKVSAASGLFRDSDTGEAHDFDLQQLFVSWVAPVGSGLKLDVGKFVTPFGYEVIEGYDGWNDNQTRGFLFGYGMPFTHTGVRAGYTFDEHVAGSLYVVQGWDDWTDNNGAKSIGAQLALTPAPDWTVYLNALGGPEQADDSHDQRFLYGATASWKTTEALTLSLDSLYGTEDGAGAGGGDASWYGAAAYARYRFSETFALAFRAETFTDADGARTGVDQTLRSFTVTPEWRAGEHVLLRGDLRTDGSSDDVFEDHSHLADTQTTVSLALLVTF